MTWSYIPFAKMNTLVVYSLIIVLFSWIQPANAFNWQDLWSTKDQQANVMMNKGSFSQAKDVFARDDWRATAAFRAGEYEQAAKLYQSIKTEDASYNQGNALAHLGQYKQALEAYDKALSLNPNNQDAEYNRKIVADLLKKEKEQQQNKDEQNQDKQNQDKQDQDKQDQDKQDQDKQDQDKQDQDKQDQDKQDQDKQDQDKQDQDKQDQDKQDQDKQDQDKQAKTNAQTQAEREHQQEKEQWLRLIPDDPGGLMREKFLRDHLRREHGWQQ